MSDKELTEEENKQRETIEMNAIYCIVQALHADYREQLELLATTLVAVCKVRGIDKDELLNNLGRRFDDMESVHQKFIKFW